MEFSRGNVEERQTLHGLPKGPKRPSSSQPYTDDERPTNQSREVSIVVIAIFSFLINFLIVNGAVTYLSLIHI